MNFRKEGKKWLFEFGGFNYEVIQRYGDAFTAKHDQSPDCFLFMQNEKEPYITNACPEILTKKAIIGRHFSLRSSWREYDLVINGDRQYLVRYHMDEGEEDNWKVQSIQKIPVGNFYMWYDPTTRELKLLPWKVELLKLYKGVLVPLNDE